MWQSCFVSINGFHFIFLSLIYLFISYLALMLGLTEIIWQQSFNVCSLQNVLNINIQSIKVVFVIVSVAGMTGDFKDSPLSNS